MFSAVEKINDEANRHPDKEAYPGVKRQKHHLEHGHESAGYRYEWHPGRAEYARDFGVTVAQNEHADAHDGKRQKRAYGNQLAQDIDGKEAGNNCRDTPCENRRYIWRFETRMNAGKSCRQ